MLKHVLCAGAVAAVAGAAAAQSDEVVRHPIPNSDFPILQAVEIPAAATSVYLSGTVPSVTNEDAAPDSMAACGDTEAQTRSVLSKIQDTLESHDLGIGDVVKMPAFLVAPEEGAGMDFDGVMTAYTEFFGTDGQSNLPTRSVVEVAGLVNPNYLVEIEVMTVRP